MRTIGVPIKPYYNKKYCIFFLMCWGDHFKKKSLALAKDGSRHDIYCYKKQLAICCGTTHQCV